MDIDWLQGIRVVVIGHYVPGPFAAYLLRMLGAEVIKVEQDQGDHLRQIGHINTRSGPSMSPMFRMLNAGFKSMGLQWRQPAGAAILKTLLAKVDVLIDGSRLGTVERALGMAPEQAAPGLIYIPITAYGQVGPMAHLAGHDNNVLALAGNLSYTSTTAEGLPAVFSAPVADLFAGQMAAFGALAALMGRQRAPSKGQRIDASMLHAGFFLNMLELAARNAVAYQPPAPGSAWMNGGRADYRPYPTRDGRHIFFGLIEPWALKKFLQALGREDLLALVQLPDQLAKGLAQMFLERDQAEWVQLGHMHDACITPVHDLQAAVHDAQVQALDLVQTVEDPVLGSLELPSYPLGFGNESAQPTLPTTAPSRGEHTREILLQLLQMEQEEVEEWLRVGVVLG